MHFPALAPSPVQLVRYELLDQFLQVHPNGDLETPSDAIALGLGVDRAVTNDLTVLTVLVSVNEAEPELGGEASEEFSPLYRGRIHVRGAFGWIGQDNLGPDEQDRLVAVNGLSVLYGIARVYVRQLSEPLPGPALLLPTLSFAEAVGPLLDSDRS